MVRPPVFAVVVAPGRRAATRFYHFEIAIEKAAGLQRLYPEPAMSGRQ
jgi:hypothetical protein